MHRNVIASLLLGYIPKTHFCFNTIKKILGKDPEQRPNLREMIQSMSSLKMMVNMMENGMSMEERIDKAQQTLKPVIPLYIF